MVLQVQIVRFHFLCDNLDIGFSQNWRYPLGGPHNKDYSILGSILGSPHFGKLPHRDSSAKISRLVGLKRCDLAGCACLRPYKSCACTLKGEDVPSLTWIPAAWFKLQCDTRIMHLPA